jgi:hypothetical protein
MPNPAHTFKRLTVGQRFTALSGPDNQISTFRKIDPKRAIKLNANGTGQTHNKIKLPRNRSVIPIS